MYTGFKSEQSESIPAAFGLCYDSKKKKKARSLTEFNSKLAEGPKSPLDHVKGGATR